MRSVPPSLLILALVDITLASCSGVAPSARPSSIDPRPNATGASAIASHAPDSDCRSFVGETVEAVAWSSAGDYLAVSTSGSFGAGRIRVFTWPDMDVVTDSETDVVAAYDAPIDDHGGVYWFTSDPFSNGIASTQLWKLEVGGRASKVGQPVRDGAYTGLIWTSAGFVSMERDPGPPERSRLVKLALVHPEAQPVGLTPWTTRIWSTFWADPSGKWLVWDEFDDAGAPQDFIVLHEGTKQVVRPPGYGGGEMTLSLDRQSLVYQRSETARLTVLDLKSGAIKGELSPLEFYGGVVSRVGILAGLTAHGPGETNQLCVLDVSARL
jgi:hypothetical protein